MNLRELLEKQTETLPLPAEENGYYLVSMSDAEHIAVEVSALRRVGAAEKGISRPAIVMTDEGIRGFQKDSRTFDDSDDTEIVLNLWGRYGGVPMAREYRVFDRHLEKHSLLSLDVAPAGWTFREMRHLREEIGERVKAGALAPAEWMTHWRDICLTRAFPGVEGNVEYLCERETDYRLTAELPLLMAACCFPGCGDDLEAFRRDYFRMIMFDLFVGQTDRTLHNYGVLVGGERESFRLAPLFDNATLAKPYLPENIYNLNGAALDRGRLLKILLRDFGGYTVPIAGELLSVYRELGRRMEEVSALWIENHNLPILLRNTKGFEAMLYEAGFPPGK